MRKQVNNVRIWCVWRGVLSSPSTTCKRIALLVSETPVRKKSTWLERACTPSGNLDCVWFVPFGWMPTKLPKMKMMTPANQIPIMPTPLLEICFVFCIPRSLSKSSTSKNVRISFTFLVAGHSKWSGCKFEIISEWHLAIVLPKFVPQDEHILVSTFVTLRSYVVHFDRLEVLGVLAVLKRPTVRQLRSVSHLCSMDS